MDDGRERRRDEPAGREGREGGLLELLRRVVAPRQPAVLVMDRDGRLRRAGAEPGEPCG
jgi:hypothetical protein